MAVTNALREVNPGKSYLKCQKSWRDKQQTCQRSDVCLIWLFNNEKNSTRLCLEICMPAFWYIALSYSCMQNYTTQYINENLKNAIQKNMH